MREGRGREGGEGRGGRYVLVCTNMCVGVCLGGGRCTMILRHSQSANRCSQESYNQ